MSNHFQRLSETTISQNTLIATWLDQNYCCKIAAIDLTNDLQQGVNRGDLKLRELLAMQSTLTGICGPMY